MSFNKDIVKDTLQQISDAICQIEDWNEGIHSSEDYGCSAEGMKTLAATCMLLEAIGEGIKKIDKVTSGSFLRIICPDIPWKDIMGMRDHIAHGYFNIDAEFVYDVVVNEIQMLGENLVNIVDILND